MTVPLGPVWRRFLPRARITTRIVAAVSVAMAVVLVAAGAFVYWRISFALDRQLDQDLRAYTDIVVRDVRAGESLPADNPGEAAQTYDASGSLLAKSDAGVRTLLDSTTVRSATTTARVVDLGDQLGRWVAKDEASYRYLAESIRMHPGQEELKTLMLNNGFGHVDYHNLTGGLVALHVGIRC